MAIRRNKKKCKNLKCEEKQFLPRRKDQLFCDKICKNDYHNEQKKLLNEVDYKREKLIRENTKKLQKLYEDPRYKSGVPEQIIRHEKIQLNLFTDQGIITNTGCTILWYHNYGLQL